MESAEVSKARKVTAAVGMLGAAGVGTAICIADGVPLWAWAPVTAAVGAAGLGLTRGSIVTKILSRGVAWAVLSPALLYVTASFATGSLPKLPGVALAAPLVAALVAAAPALGTRSARAEFAPAAGRRAFLTGATAVTTAGLAAAFGSLVRFAEMSPSSDFLLLAVIAAAGFAVLAAAYLGSAYGLLKMRGWGVLLAALTSVGLLGVGAVDHQHAFAWFVCALPTLAGIVLPVVLARLGVLRQQPPAASPVRIADEPAFVRVADFDFAEPTDEAALAPRKMALRA